MKHFEYNRTRFVTPCNPVEGVIINPIPDVVEKNKQLLDSIYSINPTTGLPSGDLAIYLSDKANPEIKSFIETQILHSLDVNSDGLSMPNQIINSMKRVIGDDDIAFFSRAHDEQPEEYAERLTNYFNDLKAVQAERKRIAHLKELMKSDSK